jgi:hypothetical protein
MSGNPGELFEKIVRNEKRPRGVSYTCRPLFCVDRSFIVQGGTASRIAFSGRAGTDRREA